MNKHAYLIMTYNNLNSLKKLLHQLDSIYNDIFIHFDKKISIDEYNDFNVSLKYSKLFKYRVFNVSWADISQTECQLFLLKEASKNNYLYYHLLSGSDFPLKSNEELFKFFNNSNKEFVHFESKYINKNKKRFIDRYYFFQKYNRRVKIIDFFDFVSLKVQKILFIDRCKKGEKYSTGANWFSITNELAKYVVSNYDNVINRYKFTRSSDEFYLQTLVINSDFVDKLYDITFNNVNCSNQRLVDWKRGNPYIFCKEDINEIMESNLCFVRKINLEDGLNDIISKRIRDGNNE